jgi:hypothetical protein
VEGPCEYANEPSGCIKFWKILEELLNLGLLKNGAAPWSQLYAYEYIYRNTFLRALHQL